MRFFDILMWTIVAAMLVLIVMNAKDVGGLLATFARFWVQETALLTGTSYKKAS